MHRQEGFLGTDRFEVIAELGAGGMGVVYEAFDHHDNKRIALKTLLNASAQALYRMKREFRSLRGIEHINLCRLGELVEQRGQWFFTMELVDGVDFLSYVRRRCDGPRKKAPVALAPTEESIDLRRNAPIDSGPPEPFDEGRLRLGLAQLAHGIAALHEAGKVHRDIKPSNIMVTDDDRVVLLDFGLVTAAGSNGGDHDGRAAGTAAYMAPEQSLPSPIGPAADWYSFGVVLYEALTGRVPHIGTSMEILLDKQTDTPAPPRAHVPDVPRDLDELCEELLQFDPRLRPSVDRILKRLGAAPEGIAAAGADSSSGPSLAAAPFLGRKRELSELTSAFESTREGQATTVVIEGESGFGKSALLREFASVADREGAIVLSGRCYEQELVPYKAFDSVIDMLSQALLGLSEEDAKAVVPRNAALLTKVFPVLGRVDSLVRAPARSGESLDPIERRSRAFAALRELLYLLAERHPLVVVIDDWQWADADSSLLLEDLLQPPDPPPLLLVVSMRPTNSDDPEPWDTHADSRDHVRYIGIGPLERVDAIELASVLLTDTSAHAASPERLADEANGHPLFIAELARHIREHGADREHPLRLDDAIHARIAALPGRARSIVETLAVAGEPLPVDVVRNAVELDAETFSRHVSRLRVAHLVKGEGATTPTLEPFHDRVRESVQAHIAPDVATQCSRRLAAALEKSPLASERPELLVAHLVAAGQRGKAAGHAQVAADQAGAALAFDRAAELYEAALRHCDDRDDNQRVLRMRYAQALVNADRGADAAPIFLKAAAGADAAVRLECHRHAAEQWLKSGHLDSGVAAIRELLDEIGEPWPTTPQRALASVVWSQMKMRARGMRWSERPEADIPRSELIRLDVLMAVGQALSVTDYMRGAAFQARFSLGALRAGEPTRIATALSLETGLAAAVGGSGVKRAEQMRKVLREIADKDGGPRLQSLAIATDAMVHFFAGRFDDAVQLLKTAEGIIRDRVPGMWWERSSYCWVRYAGMNFRGSLAACRVLFDKSIRDARRRNDRYLESTLRPWATPLWLADDDPAGARENLATAPWPAPAEAMHFQHMFEVQAQAQLALYERRDVDQLELLASRLETFARSLLCRIQVNRIGALFSLGNVLLASAVGNKRRSNTRKVARLARTLRRQEPAFGAALASLLEAGVALFDEDRHRAIACLRAAARDADNSGTFLHAAVARYRLGELVAGDEGSALRTEAEDWLRRQGVRNSAKFAHVFAPTPPSIGASN